MHGSGIAVGVGIGTAMLANALQQGFEQSAVQRTAANWGRFAGQQAADLEEARDRISELTDMVDDQAGELALMSDQLAQANAMVISLRRQLRSLGH